MCAVARHLAEAGGAAPHLMIPRVWTRHVPAAMSTCDNPSCIDIVRALERTWPARRFQRTRAHALRAQVFKCPKGNYAVCQKVPHPNPRQTTSSPALPGRRHHLGCAATTHAIERPAVGLPRRGASLSTRAKRRTAHQQFRNARQPSQRNALYGSPKVRMPTLRSPASTACALGAFGCPPRIHHEPDSS